MSIRYQLNTRKAVEAAAMFLRLHKEPMWHLALMKLLYIADRRALESLESPITEDKYCSMDYGPVLSGVYNLMKGERASEQEIWSTFISPIRNHKVALIQDPGNDELCQAEEEIIKAVYDEFGGYKRFDLARITHDFPEWQNPNGSSIPILVETILTRIGKSQVEIQSIEDEVSRERYLDALLNG